jgi:tRNA nucleotidyltransferase/poly(A) polymerase
LLGTHRKDYDFTLPREAASAIPTIEEALQFRFFKVGKEELDRRTYRIIKEEMSLDITLFEGHDVEEDLRRRDFTINAIAFSLNDRTFHWVEGALNDIEKKILRTVSSRSIDQDPLRMRAIRSLHLAGFAISEELMAEISSKGADYGILGKESDGIGSSFLSPPGEALREPSSNPLSE